MWFTITGRFGTRWRWRRPGKTEVVGPDLLHGAARGVHQAGSEVLQAQNILLGSLIQEHVHDQVRLERVTDRSTVVERFAADEPWLSCHAAHATPSRTFREVATQSPGVLSEYSCGGEGAPAWTPVRRVEGAARTGTLFW